MTRLPRIAIIGRPNVGKSTLFNRLTHTRAALVDDRSGVTRDWIARPWAVQPDCYAELIDLCGFQENETDPVLARSQAALRRFFADADLILLVVDARAGIEAADRWIASEVRRSGKPVVLVANKVESADVEHRVWQVAELGWMPVPVSAEHDRGIDELADAVAAALHGAPVPTEEPEIDVRIAIVGRPNAGKSTLLNALVGESRATVSEVPGTTRDAIDAIGKVGNLRARFVDTAGIRRRRSVTDQLEAAAATRSLEAAKSADIVYFLVRADEGLTQQDQLLISDVAKAGKGILLLFTHWDRIEDAERRFRELEDARTRDLDFLPWLPRLTLSAVSGHNMARLGYWTELILRELDTTVTTAQLNRVFGEILERNPPPSVQIRQTRRRKREKPFRIYYATQTGRRPLKIRVFGNVRSADLPENYRRYLENRLREALKLQHVPVIVEFRGKRQTKRGTRKRT